MGDKIEFEEIRQRRAGVSTVPGYLGVIELPEHASPSSPTRSAIPS